MFLDVGKTHKDKFLHPRRESGIDDGLSVNCSSAGETFPGMGAEEDARDVNDAGDTRANVWQRRSVGEVAVNDLYIGAFGHIEG
jgi:hypothetical protein